MKTSQKDAETTENETLSCRGHGCWARDRCGRVRATGGAGAAEQEIGRARRPEAQQQKEELLPSLLLGRTPKKTQKRPRTSLVVVGPSSDRPAVTSRPSAGHRQKSGFRAGYREVPCTTRSPTDRARLSLSADVRGGAKDADFGEILTVEMSAPWLLRGGRSLVGAPDRRGKEGDLCLQERYVTAF